MASRSAKPVRTIRSSGSGRVAGSSGNGLGAVAPATTGLGARARAPSVIRGAAAPQRAWRLATAAVTSAERVAIGHSR